MGNNQPTKIIDFKKKLFIVIDLYLKPKFDDLKNFDIDEFKTNSIIKKNLKDIIVNSLLNKINYNISLQEHNLFLICKKDKNDVKYLELNAIIEFSDKPEKVKIDELSNNVSDNISKEFIKLNILSALYTYVSNKYGIITSDITLVILYNTLYNIDIYQKK